MHFTSVFMVNLFELFLSFVKEYFLVLIHIISILEEESDIFNRQIFTFVYFYVMVPFPHCSLLLFLLFV